MILNLGKKIGKQLPTKMFDHTENFERQILSTIDVVTECKEQRAKLPNSPPASEATMLEKMCTNHAAKLTSLRNATIPHITIRLLKGVQQS